MRYSKWAKVVTMIIMRMRLKKNKNKNKTKRKKRIWVKKAKLRVEASVLRSAMWYICNLHTKKNLSPIAERRSPPPPQPGPPLSHLHNAQSAKVMVSRSCVCLKLSFYLIFNMKQRVVSIISHARNMDIGTLLTADAIDKLRRCSCDGAHDFSRFFFFLFFLFKKKGADDDAHNLCACACVCMCETLSVRSTERCTTVLTARGE